MLRLLCVWTILAAALAPTYGQFCEKLAVHQDTLRYPRDLNDPDALGCHKYATIEHSENFIDGDQVTVLWEVQHTGANQLHFALSEGPAAKPSDKEGDSKAFRGAVYRTTGDGIGLHTLTYGLESSKDESEKIRKTGQRFYELLMYPNGEVKLRRVSCDSNSGEFDETENKGGCERFTGPGIYGKHEAGFTYNSNDKPHKFWMTFNKKSGVFKFGDGEIVGQKTILDWTDPKPIPVTSISANVYCCHQRACALLTFTAETGYFCFCSNKDAGWCTGPPPPTTTFTKTSTTTSVSLTTTATSTTTTVSSTTETVTTVTATTQQSCGAGKFRNKNDNECKNCPDGQFQSKLDHTHDACVVQLGCRDDEYVKTNATSTSDTVCATTKECRPGEEYESKPHAPGKVERECSAITECVAGEYLRKPATRTADNDCVECDGSTASFAGGLCSTTTTSATSTTTTATETTTTTRTFPLGTQGVFNLTVGSSVAAGDLSEEALAALTAQVMAMLAKYTNLNSSDIADITIAGATGDRRQRSQLKSRAAREDNNQLIVRVMLGPGTGFAEWQAALTSLEEKIVSGEIVLSGPDAEFIFSLVGVLPGQPVFPTTSTTVTSTTTTGIDTTTITSTTTTVLVEPEDDTAASITQADLTNAENALDAATNMVETFEDQLAKALEGSDLTIEDIKEADGDAEMQALLEKGNMDPDEIWFLKDSYTSVMETLSNAEQDVNNAEAAYASAINPPKAGSSSTTAIVIALVLIIIIVVIGGAYYYVANNTPSAGGRTTLQNPAYEAPKGGAPADVQRGATPKQNVQQQGQRKVLVLDSYGNNA